MPSIGDSCHELRITDAGVNCRIVYRSDPDAIVIAEVFRKKTRKTPKDVIAVSQERLRRYDSA